MARPAGVHPPGSQSGWSFFVAIVVLFTVQIFFAQWVLHGVDKPAGDMAWRGQLGDMFGGVNAFFTGAAFIAVTFTLILQRRENAAQRVALEGQLAALERSARAQAAQEEALKESASLRAMTALMNAYSARLAPYWAQRASLNLEYERYSREVDVAQAKSRRALLHSSEYVYWDNRQKELRERREFVNMQINNLEDFWSADIRTQNDFVSTLEALVEQTQQSQ